MLLHVSYLHQTVAHFGYCSLEVSVLDAQDFLGLGVVDGEVLVPGIQEHLKEGSNQEPIIMMHLGYSVVATFLKSLPNSSLMFWVSSRNHLV